MAAIDMVAAEVAKLATVSIIAADAGPRSTLNATLFTPAAPASAGKPRRAPYAATTRAATGLEE
ncbi:hypothetical protein [Rubrivivax gelatinosus]|uniref:hypothetical protein n=1 Tax=Rubrivivax gelatinosus TaxID=28068 RepID=UPI00190622E5|nr:hypothetical protein [Rubrivivax gelatinosus]